MTAVNCPMCVLRFATRTERDWHLRNEHQHAHVHPPTNQSAPWTPAGASGGSRSRTRRLVVTPGSTRRRRPAAARRGVRRWSVDGAVAAQRAAVGVPGRAGPRRRAARPIADAAGGRPDRPAGAPGPGRRGVPAPAAAVRPGLRRSGSSRGRMPPTSGARRTASGDRAAAARPDEELRLLAAVPPRRTVRTPFRRQDVPVPLRVAWREHAEAEGAGLRWVEGPGERIGVAALVAAAERLQQRDPAYLAELDHWTALERRSPRAPASRRPRSASPAPPATPPSSRCGTSPAAWRPTSRGTPARSRSIPWSPCWRPPATGRRTGCAAARR